MGQLPTGFEASVSSVRVFVAQHPRIVMTVALLVCLFATQGVVGAASTDPVALGNVTVEPNGGHGATNGP